MQTQHVLKSNPGYPVTEPGVGYVATQYRGYCFLAVPIFKGRWSHTFKIQSIILFLLKLCDMCVVLKT